MTPPPPHTPHPHFCSVSPSGTQAGLCPEKGPGPASEALVGGCGGDGVVRTGACRWAVPRCTAHYGARSPGSPFPRLRVVGAFPLQRQDSRSREELECRCGFPPSPRLVCMGAPGPRVRPCGPGHPGFGFSAPWSGHWPEEWFLHNGFPLAPLGSATPVEGWVGGWEAQIPPNPGSFSLGLPGLGCRPFLRLSETPSSCGRGEGGLRSVCVKAFVWSHFWAAASQIKPRSLWVEPGQGAEGASVFHKPFPWGSQWGK